MCDSIAIVQKDRVLFAKNSDRDPNEAQFLEWLPRRTYPKGATLRCTWITVPQVEKTQAVLLSRPFWMWGAEVGANEYGVAVGNEAVFTRQPREKPGLIGMDLVRLALERADTAKRACEVIATLLEQYGQGGGCGHENRRFAYHNSFLVADTAGAFVLETAGRRWRIEPVNGARSISNALTIPEFARAHTARLKTRIAMARIRQQRTHAFACRATRVADLLGILQDHGDGNEHPRYSLSNGALAAPCVHAGGILAATQTTGSWVSELRREGSLHWVTATAAPCISLYKPVRVEHPVDLGPPPTDLADNSLWWRHERLHRTVMQDPEVLRPLFIRERDEVQQAWLRTPPDSQDAFAQADRFLEDWTRAVLAHPCPDTRPWYVQRYWAKRTTRAKLTFDAA